MFLNDTGLEKAKSLKEGDMVSWNSAGGKATGKVVHVMDYGTLDIPNVKFKIKGEKDNPAVLIQLYRDGKPTDIQVGHKMSTLSKSLGEPLLKHGSHNQSSHGRKGGKGGGGSSQESGELEDKLVEASEGLDNMIVGAQKLVDNAKDRKSFDMARGAIRGFKDVKSALGDKKQMKAVRLKRNSKAAQIMKTPGSLAPLQEGYAENVGYVQGATSALAQYGDL